jgi:FG-GAP-like repeat/FG-GAP repeat
LTDFPKFLHIYNRKQKLHFYGANYADNSKFIQKHFNDCRFDFNNLGGQRFGGVFAEGSFDLTNSTVSGNTATKTGAGILFNTPSNINRVYNITNSTIAGNTAAGQGGGLSRAGAGTFTTVNLRNSIFANNTDNATAPDLDGTYNSNGYNLIENITGATITGMTTGNITGVDPRLDPILRTNGGTTKTHALHLTSPARNAADPANNPATDQRGLARTTPDIGAYERQANDVVVPAMFDFDDDVKADISVFRPNANPAIADFYISRSSDNAVQTFSWGLPGNKLAPADYDGDGKTDIAVYREMAQSRFYIFQSATNTVREDDFGVTGDVLTVGDWDFDGKADVSVYRDAAQSIFFYRGSLNNPAGNITYYPFGTSGDKPMRGDFDGDGKQDAAVYRASNNVWYIRQSSDNQIRYENWGLSTDTLVPADYDNDGKTDIAVFRSGIWYIKQSISGNISFTNFGLSGDNAVPNAFITP